MQHSAGHRAAQTLGLSVAANTLGQPAWNTHTDLIKWSDGAKPTFNKRKTFSNLGQYLLY